MLYYGINFYRIQLFCSIKCSRCDGRRVEKKIHKEFIEEFLTKSIFLKEDSNDYRLFDANGIKLFPLCTSHCAIFLDEEREKKK